MNPYGQPEDMALREAAKNLAIGFIGGLVMLAIAALVFYFVCWR